jgi:long-chain fatty acid transport protein
MKKRLLAVLLATAPFAAHATDGYFAHGYGVRALGMGGTGVALALEPFGGAINPASSSFLGNTWQLGVTWFSPDRRTERTGSGPANMDGSVRSESRNFFIPEFGINWALNPSVTVGLTVYGNGGMNTDYAGDQIPAQSACAQFNPGPASAGLPYNLLCGGAVDADGNPVNGQLGVNLEQLMIAPYLSWKFVPNHAIGIAPTIAYQRFKAYGMQAFDNPFLSTSPGNVTNRGTNDSWGYGARFGYMGHFGPVAVGAAYATKMKMDEFSKYRGLFAEEGGFDIPSNFTVGFAFRPTPQWLLALDYQRIYYDDAPSVSNPLAYMYACVPPAFGGLGARENCLGGSSGAGFGWENITVWKFGVQWAMNDRWTFRAGYNRSGQPITSPNVTFNIIAPGVVQNQYTLGGTWRLDAVSEVTGAFMYAADESVTGPSFFAPFNPALASTTETIHMKQYLLGIAYNRKF